MDVRNNKSSRNFTHPFLIHVLAVRAAPPSPSRVSPRYQKLFTHPYVSPITTRSSARSYSWIVPSHHLRLKPSTTSDKSPHTPLVNPLFTYCALNRVCMHSSIIIFPPLLPSYTLDFPAFTFSPLSIRLSLHSTTHLPSCSIVDELSTKSSEYSNSEGRLLLASLETTSITTTNSS